MFRFTPAVLNILIINVVIFIVQSLFGVNLIGMLGLRYIEAETFAVPQFVTHMFVHAGLSHVFFNMLGLAVFGPWVESRYGTKNFLILYFVCGIGAGMLYSGFHYTELKSMEKEVAAYAQDPNPDSFVQFLRNHNETYYAQSMEFIEQYDKAPDNPAIKQNSITRLEQFYYYRSNTPMIGASGAVFGIILVFGLLFPNVELMLLFPPIPIKAKYIVIFYGLTAVYGIIQRAEGDNVAHFAHLGGMLFGWLMFTYWKKN